MNGVWQVVARALAARGALRVPASGSDLDRLASHQREAVLAVETALSSWGGVLLADAVGLGKTWVAVAIARRAHRRGEDTVAFVPATLVGMWSEVAAGFHVPLEVVGHETLASRRVDLGRWSSASLVIVDEAHRFRNPATRRYPRLARLAVGRRLLLVTATPLNNSPDDLFHLLRLFMDEAAERRLGIGDLRAALRATQERSDGDWLSRVLIRRRRGDIYEPRLSSGHGFPDRRLATIDYSFADVYGNRHAEHLERLESVGHHLLADRDESARPGCAALISLGLARRLESSRAAFAASLRRQHRFLRRWGEARRRGRRLTRAANRRWFSAEEAQQEIFIEFLLGELHEREAREIGGALHWLDEWRALLIGIEGDAKAEALIDRLRRLPEREPVIVFSEYRDTVHDLERRLRVLPRRIARLDSHGAMLDGRAISREEVLARFAPRAHAAPVRTRERIDLLVSTDLLAEGTNLQDAVHVVSYDLPWNPVRLEQRAGRIDRLGSWNELVTVWTMQPREEAVLEPVVRALQRKRAQAIEVLGRDAPLLRDEPAGDAVTRSPTAQILTGSSSLAWLADEVRRRRVSPGGPTTFAATGGSPAAAGELICLRPRAGEGAVWRFHHRTTRALWRDVERIASHLRRFLPALREDGRVDERFLRTVERCRADLRRGLAIVDEPFERGTMPLPRRRLLARLEEGLTDALRIGDRARAARMGGIADRLLERPSAGVELLIDDLEHRAPSLDERALLRELERVLPARDEPLGLAIPEPELICGLQIRCTRQSPNGPTPEGATCGEK